MVVTMLLLLWLIVVVVPLPRWPSKLTAAEHVNVEVVHGLRAVLAVCELSCKSCDFAVEIVNMTAWRSSWTLWFGPS